VEKGQENSSFRARSLEDSPWKEAGSQGLKLRLTSNGVASVGEAWGSSEDLPTFNANLVGSIEVIDRFSARLLGRQRYGKLPLDVRSLELAEMDMTKV
jgi:hypothetical protein